MCLYTSVWAHDRHEFMHVCLCKHTRSLMCIPWFKYSCMCVCVGRGARGGGWGGGVGTYFLLAANQMLLNGISLRGILQLPIFVCVECGHTLTRAHTQLNSKEYVPLNQTYWCCTFVEQNKTWRICKINIYSFCLPAKNKRRAASDNSIKSCISACVCVFCHVHECVSPLSAPLCQPLPTTQHTAVQQCILQAPIFGWIPFCNNWIIAVREGFSSDYTDYGLQRSDGQCGLKSIIWLVSLRKSFLANVQIWCLSTFIEKKIGQKQQMCHRKLKRTKANGARKRKGRHLIEIIFVESVWIKEPRFSDWLRAVLTSTNLWTSIWISMET